MSLPHTHSVRYHSSQPGRLLNRLFEGVVRRFSGGGLARKAFRPFFDGLESRRVFSSGPVYEVVFQGGALYQYDDTGTHHLADGVQTASLAYNSAGSPTYLIVFQGGALYQYDASGVRHLADGVKDASIAFNSAGSPTYLIVFANGNLEQYDASGVRFLAGGVQSASIAFYPAGDPIYFVVFAGGDAYSYSASGVSPIMSPLSSASAAFAPTIDVLYVGPGGSLDESYLDASSSFYLRHLADGVQFASIAYARSTSSPPAQPPPNPGDPGAPGLPGLESAYKGVVQDRAADLNGNVAIIAAQGGNNIYLANIHAISDQYGDNVAGVMTITNWAGDVINVSFVGLYSTVGGATLNITNTAGTQVGGVFFGIDFVIQSDGSLFVTHGLGGGFYIYDERNGYFDDGAGDNASWGIHMVPNPSGTA